MGCYLLKYGDHPPKAALPLWNDDVNSDQIIPHLMDKAAERNVSPSVVAEFSEIAGAVARIDERRGGYCWVISRSQQA
jgi:hypothetical protein